MPFFDERGLPTSETIQLLQNRVSVRSYTDRPVDDAHVEAILRAAFRAPTSSNIQAYSVVVVRDPDTLARLAPVTGNQKHVANAPVFLAFCADMRRMEHAVHAFDARMDDNNLEMGLVSSIDAALVGMSASLAAESLGLMGVMIGAIRNNAAETARILGLPNRVYAVFGMVLGWPADVPQQKPRMPYESMVHLERFGNHPGGVAMAEAIRRYDQDLAQHYRGQGRTTNDDSWTAETGSKFAKPPRQRLREELEGQGFDFR
ncbi:MAG: nitroreductase family protein [Alphaproteobacteria bacterium]|nr:nitroreductase family protein [Alphaproteobacteria bacterium]MCB9931047.1 nitroreductase family protein [Alphaproteobacteria bacterium]